MVTCNLRCQVSHFFDRRWVRCNVRPFTCLTRVCCDRTAAESCYCIVREPSKQEHRLRLLLRVHLAVHEFGSRRTRHDFYHWTWERHREPFPLLLSLRSGRAPAGSAAPCRASTRPVWSTSVVLSSLLRPGGPTNRTCCDSVLQVCRAIEAVAGRLVNKEVELLFADMGKAWDHLVADPQLRWCVASSFSSSVSVLAGRTHAELPCHRVAGRI